MEYITHKKFDKNELLGMPVSTLAWIGDAVYTVCARDYVIKLHNYKPAKLHKMSIEYVNAEAQSMALEKISAYLTEEELNIVRRAKNSPITTKSKHYGLADYKRATGFEALVGYLYLLDKIDRLNELLKIIFEEKVC